MTDQQHAMPDWQIEPQSEHSFSSLKSGLGFLAGHQGSWCIENGLATFTSWPSGRVDRYNQETLELAIQNTKDNRSGYKTYDAYRAALFHLQSGLAMLNVCIKSNLFCMAEVTYPE